ncbi:M48 family metalloprotease [Cellvibrio sp. UBA7661]|uniref:M48 family metalloprotease n=1 Tax=Cellvibrio sp. UBA7661 TaxID=1946311 RepID=UPI002F358B53
MNFFEHQDRAKRKSKQLILLLAVAVASLVAITVLLFATLIYVSQQGNTDAYGNASPQSFWAGVSHALTPQAIAWIAIGITSVVLLGSLFRFLQLKSGGRSVAEAMGGRLLHGNTQDSDERKILNVVEEIAIASGTAVPPVYLIEDDAINAFAAGYKPQDAVIGITRGCINQLTRDELQGVIAHEFSHIFHGDMRLNMRLIALLYGILLIGLIGEFLIRHAGNRNIRRSSKDNSPFVMLVLGLGLLIIGYTGTFFGNLIKAAVSRQREFLADASAVQFTRNPDGIAGALKKIGGSSSGSELHNEHAAEFSHMYFSQGVKLFFNLMATHPPLTERIKRINPYWDGHFAENTYKGRKTLDAADGAMGLHDSTADNAAIDINATLQQIAQPTVEQIGVAQERLSEIPRYIKEATLQAFSARAVVFGLLLDRHPDLRTQQLALLNNYVSEDELDNLQRVINNSAMLETRLRLPALELCMPALKELSPSQRQHFLAGLNALINSDKKVSLLEWSFYRIVQHNLEYKPNIQRSLSLRDLHAECQLLLSLLAYAGADNNDDANAAFIHSQSLLPFPALTLLPRGQIKLANADIALEKLNRVKPLQKPQLLKAMSACIHFDGRISVVETEIFRAIADSLDCPIPPLIPRITN